MVFMIGIIGRYRLVSGIVLGFLGREEYGKKEGRECIVRWIGLEGYEYIRENRMEEGDDEMDDGLVGLMNGLGIERCG